MSYSGRQPTGAGHDEAASSNSLTRNKSKTPIPQPPSPAFESLHSTATATSATAAACEISPSELDRITHPFRNSFTARIYGKDMSRWQLASRLNRHLHLTTPVEVLKLNRGIFVLNFSEKDYLTLLGVDNPWSIPNLCIHAVRWKPNFKPSEAVIHVVDVWIRLQELPIEYYDDDTLRKIAEFIGIALVMIDPVTKDRTKCKFGRICVKLNLCNPLVSMIKINGILQDIEYEGFDLLCPRCSRVLDFCPCNPSGSSRFDPHNCRARTETGSSSNSKQQLNSYESSGSRYQILAEEPQALFLDLNENQNKICEAASKTITAPEIEQINLAPSIALNDPSMSFSSYPDAALEIEENNLIPSIAFHDHPMSISSYPEANSPTFEVPVVLNQTNLIPSITSNDHPVPISSFPEAAETSTTDLDNHPTSASTTVTASAELEPKNSNLSIGLATFVGEDKFRATESCGSTSQLQPSAATASIPSQQSIPTSEIALLFYLSVIERSVIEKDITPFEGNGIGISHRPIIYTIHESISSLTVGLSENPNSVPKENQFAIHIKSRSGGGNKKMLGWKVPGRYNANQIKGLKSVVLKYDPSIIVIFASRISDDDKDEVQEELDFCGTYCKMPDDNNRGVWLLLFKHDVETEVFPALLLDSALAYADTETSWQTWEPASFCDSTYPMGNTLAC